MIFAGIGSRSSPQDILEQMSKIAEHLCGLGWILRTGGADGADLAFEKGCDNIGGKKEVYLPWPKFNSSSSLLHTPSADAFILASTVHPYWDNLSYGAKKLHARNCHQILGIELDDPVNLVICWTPNGKEVGGTATALKLAKTYNIKIINLAIDTFDNNQYY